MSMVADLTKHLFSLGPEAIEEIAAIRWSVEWPLGQQSLVEAPVESAGHADRKIEAANTRRKD